MTITCLQVTSVTITCLQVTSVTITCLQVTFAHVCEIATNYCDKRLGGQKVSNLGIPPQKQLVLVDLGGPRHGPCFFQFHGVLMKNARIIS